VLWEITWCVILYSTVLVLEFIPIIVETKWFDGWARLRRLSHNLHKATPFFALFGMALSLLHQSSLGATYGVLSGRAIWFKPSMPIMFILSAIAGGMALTLLATMVTGKLQGRRIVPLTVQREISRFIGYVLLGYLYIKLWDWAATSYYSYSPGIADALARLQATTPYTLTFWWWEIVLGGLIPAIVLLYPRLRRDNTAVAIALGLVVMSVVVNRWNVTLSGLVVPPEWSPGCWDRWWPCATSPRRLRLWFRWAFWLTPYYSSPWGCVICRSTVIRSIDPQISQIKTPLPNPPPKGEGTTPHLSANLCVSSVHLRVISTQCNCAICG
jgi:Ni/Fe-hydrogenase subunit HybB-like protein